MFKEYKNRLFIIGLIIFIVPGCKPGTKKSTSEGIVSVADSLSVKDDSLFEGDSSSFDKPGTVRRVKKPNILILFTDDQRYSTINSWGYDEVQTPNMDRLANEGMSFLRAHIMGGTSGAVCMPSRAMLMTSKSLFHLKSKGAVIPKDHVMMPEVFKKAGYRTFGTGKWHNGKAAFARAFTDGGKIFFGGMSNHLKVLVFDFDPSGVYPENKKYVGEKFSSELFADEAIKFLDHYSGRQPFFMYVAFTAPHDPRMAPEAYAKLYPPEKIKVPLNFMPKHPFDNGELWVRDEQLAPWPRTQEIIQQNIAAYYAMITHLDAQIGRILDALEKSGKAKNTIIIFAGDNGLALGQHGLMGKQNIYEHSIRVPLIFAGTGIPRDEKTEALCYLNDIYPTLCNLTGLSVPGTVEGKSLVPVLKNKNKIVRDKVFYAYRNFQRGIRTDDNWKLILYNVNNKNTAQLFNLNKDPWELNNLAQDPAYADKLNELTAMLDEYMHSVNDPMNLKKKNWGKPEIILPNLKENHLAKGKPVELLTKYSPKYSGGGPGAITDGLHGTLRIGDPHWQGYEGVDFEAIIDLGKPMDIRFLSSRYLLDAGSWVFLPEYVEYSISKDGKSWIDIGKMKHKVNQNTEEKKFIDMDVRFEKMEVRYVKVKAKNIGKCPSWHVGAGGKAWLFVDEVVVK